MSSFIKTKLTKSASPGENTREITGTDLGGDKRAIDVSVKESVAIGVADPNEAYQRDRDSTDLSIVYYGFAAIGTATSSAGWKIFYIDTNGDAQEKLWADGDANYDNVWDNRESLSYS